MNIKEVPFESLRGKALESVVGLYKGSDCVEFECTDGSIFYMKPPFTTSSVRIEDIGGEITDIVGIEILIAEVKSFPGSVIDYRSNSILYTRIVYVMITTEGILHIHWYAVSNDHHIKKVGFYEVIE